MIIWHRNAKCEMKGTKLYIEVELNPDKIWASPLGYLSSRLRRYEESPAGRIEVNIHVRKLKPGE